MVLCHVIHGVAQLVAQVIPVDDVGGLGVQLSNFFFVEPLSEASHLGKLTTRLQHHQDANQAQQQVDWESKHTHVRKQRPAQCD